MAGVHQQTGPTLFVFIGIPTHGPPSEPVKPALQMHCVSEVELAGELDPDGQDVGAVVPELGQYVPAGHTAVCACEDNWRGPEECMAGEHSLAAD